MKGTAKLRWHQILRAQRFWNDSNDVSFLDIAIRLDSLQPYFMALETHDVIEIGPGNNPINKHYTCRRYEAAVRSYPHDGLSVLRSKKPGSAIVVSFGVIDDSILMGNYNNLCRRYAEELAGEIKRVANPFSIIFGVSAENYMGSPDISAYNLFKDGGVYLRDPDIISL